MAPQERDSIVGFFFLSRIFHDVYYRCPRALLLYLVAEREIFVGLARYLDLPK